MTVISHVFQKYDFSKTWLDKYQISTSPEYHRTINMVNCPNTFEILTEARLSYLLITVKAIEFEKVTLSDMQNLKTVC